MALHSCFGLLFRITHTVLDLVEQRAAWWVYEKHLAHRIFLTEVVTAVHYCFGAIHGLITKEITTHE